MVQDGGDRDARGEIAQIGERDPVAFLNLLVVRRVGEGQGQDSLLLQVTLMDARERLRDDRRAAEIARGHGGVLAARALAVVLVADHDPLLPRRLVGARHPGHLDAALPGQQIDRFAALSGEGVHGAQERVVADLVEVAAEAQPEARRGDVIGCCLSLGLQEKGHLDEVGVHHRVERR